MHPFRYNRKSIFFLLLSFFLTAHSSIFGQQNMVQGNFNNWFFLHPKISIQKHWVLGTEIHLRQDNWIKNPRNLLIRPYGIYHFNENFNIAAGYSYIRSWGVAPFYTPTVPSNENNLWEQFTLVHKIKALAISHRYRLEQRFIDKWASGLSNKKEVIFSNRFRYRLTFKFPIFQFNEDAQIYGHLFDEVWLNQHNNLLFKNLGRNWVYLGLGYKFNPTWNIELAYMNQQDLGAKHVIYTHLVQLSLGYLLKIKH